MDADELDLVLETARRLLTEGPPERLAAELDDADLAGPVREDPGPLFELQGRLTASSTLLDLAVLPGAGVPDWRGTRLVLPPPGTSSPPGHEDGPDVEVDGVVLGGGAPAGAYAVWSERGGALVIGGDRLTRSPVSGFDPGLGVTRVTGRVPAGAGGVTGWSGVAAVASRAFAWELVGLAESALAIGVGHVRDRRQFGRPIGEFQVVRHRLADVRTAITAAREVLLVTADDSLAVLTGKALAGRAALSAVRAAQQVCGAMGFTWEHSLHRIVRRVYLIDSMFGASEGLSERIGGLLLAGGVVPRLAGLGGSV